MAVGDLKLGKGGIVYQITEGNTVNAVHRTATSSPPPFVGGTAI